MPCRKVCRSIQGMILTRPPAPLAEPPRLRRRPCRGSEPKTAPSGYRQRSTQSLCLTVWNNRKKKGVATGIEPPLGPGQTQRPRPADETGSCVWRSAPVFASTHCGAPQKSAKRKRNAVYLLQGRHDARRKSREPQPKEFLSRDCAQKWVPPKACRFSTR